MKVLKNAMLAYAATCFVITLVRGGGGGGGKNSVKFYCFFLKQRFRRIKGSSRLLLFRYILWLRSSPNGSHTDFRSCVRDQYFPTMDFNSSQSFVLIFKNYNQTFL